MAHPDPPSEHDKSQEDTKEKDPVQSAGPTALQKARARFLKGVSYFAGDMPVFAKWMESELTLTAYLLEILTYLWYWLYP